MWGSDEGLSANVARTTTTNPDLRYSEDRERQRGVHAADFNAGDVGVRVPVKCDKKSKYAVE